MASAALVWRENVDREIAVEVFVAVHSLPSHETLQVGRHSQTGKTVFTKGSGRSGGRRAAGGEKSVIIMDVTGEFEF